VDWVIANSSCLLAEGDAPGGLGPLAPVFTVVVIFALYMFIVQQPKAKREQQARQDMLKNLKKNDHVLTTSGIYGVVTNVQIDAEEVTLRVDDASNTRLRMTLSSIARVFGDGSSTEKDAKKE
jgi:preprotein translocase subunit YajC